MAIVNKNNTFSAGAVIVASEHNANFDTIFNDYNGNVTNANLSASAAIVDTKLGQITTASKVSFTALVAGTTPLNEAKGSDIASATTTDIGAATGNYLNITGTTTITGLGTVTAGARRIVQFGGILILTYDASALILPGNASITTAAGDIAEFVSLGSGNWICTRYQIDANTPNNVADGQVVQVVNFQTGAVATGTTVMVDDDTIPQNTEGNQFMTLAITPKSTTNKLKIEIVVCGGEGANHTIIIGLFQDSTVGALAAMHSFASAGAVRVNAFTHYMTAGTTSSTTFNVRAGMANAGTFTFNGVSSARKLGGAIASSITITEIKAS